jgi:hypothetical protein
MRPISRRHLVLGSAAGLAALAGLSGCKKAQFSCDGVVGLSVEDIKLRNTLGYVDRSPDPKKSCALCQQFEPAPNEGACGSCKMLKGPIHPDGSCKVYALRT